MLDGAGLFDRSSMHLLMAKDGYDVLSICRGKEVWLALLTQTLGSVSGLSVVRALKQLDAVPSVVMVMKDADPPSLRAATAAGCDEVLVEPIDVNLLTATVARMLGVATRQDVRVLTRLRCETSDPERRKMAIGTAIDISASGMRVETEGDFRVDESLSAEFYLPGSNEPCMVACKVVRRHDEDNLLTYGLKFMGMPTGLAGRIVAFVNKRQSPT